MAIGIVSNDDMQAELDRLNGRKPVQIIEKPSKGRDEGDLNVPDSLRKIIGETAVIDGRQEALALASMFDISDSSVSAYAKGATSTATINEPKPSILSHINKARQRSISRASKKLNQALGSLTQDKLDNESARDLASIARDMSVIIKNLEPQKVDGTDETKQAPQFVIFAPQFRNEQSFETIVVNE